MKRNSGASNRGPEVYPGPWTSCVDSVIFYTASGRSNSTAVLLVTLRREGDTLINFT